MEQVLVADGVSKTYGETTALDDVSIAVDEGEVLALVGPNGAGKTTLVRTLTGTTVPDAGTVRVLGSDPATVDRAALGVLPQAFSPPDRLTARELLRYYAGLYDEARNPEAVLDDLGLAEAADSRYGALSGGQQRRVCLGAALVNDPAVLVLDEPTSGIDPAGRRTIRGLIADLADAGSTVLVTTHDMDEAERIADRVALLADGRLRATGSPAELVREHGGSTRLVVEGVDAAAATEALEAADYETAVREGELRVPNVPTERIGDVVAVLDDAGVTYEELAWQRPSLEDAYMALASDDGVAGPAGGGSTEDDGGNSSAVHDGRSIPSSGGEGA